MSAKTALKKAIKKAGGQSALARKLGISQQSIQQWVVVPLKRVKQVSEITGVPCEELAPELFK
ncbi:transcriptional regulator [Parasutterella excrementihominis]|uniref:transcriptional regulator n=1 Tax=Parasutterella excrementihominis TaxID=487175 RepID=UPI00248D2364|nr:Cro/CI family transcriptional regulator [Parasutterella excrementihominis]